MEPYGSEVVRLPLRLSISPPLAMPLATQICITSVGSANPSSPGLSALMQPCHRHALHPIVEEKCLCPYLGAALHLHLSNLFRWPDPIKFLPKPIIMFTLSEYNLENISQGQSVPFPCQRNKRNSHWNLKWLWILFTSGPLQGYRWIVYSKHPFPHCLKNQSDVAFLESHDSKNSSQHHPLVNK